MDLEVLKALGEFKEVRYRYGTIGAGDADTVRDGMVFVKLVPRSERTQSMAAILHQLLFLDRQDLARPLV